MRQITKGIERTIDGNLPGFRLTKPDACTQTKTAQRMLHGVGEGVMNGSPRTLFL